MVRGRELRSALAGSHVLLLKAPLIRLERRDEHFRPVDRFRGEVLPEWIDYNGHMNLAYYTVLFDQATDLLFDVLGLGLDYRRDRKLGTFVAETHNLYERELLVGAGVRVATQIIAIDAKRMHIGHEMYALDGPPAIPRPEHGPRRRN